LALSTVASVSPPPAEEPNSPTLRAGTIACAAFKTAMVSSIAAGK
jgi:hypothetical protein